MHQRSRLQGMAGLLTGRLASSQAAQLGIDLMDRGIGGAGFAAVYGFGEEREIGHGLILSGNRLPQHMECPQASVLHDHRAKFGRIHGVSPSCATCVSTS